MLKTEKVKVVWADTQKAVKLNTICFLLIKSSGFWKGEDASVEMHQIISNLSQSWNRLQIHQKSNSLYINPKHLETFDNICWTSYSPTNKVGVQIKNVLQ